MDANGNFEPHEILLEVVDLHQELTAVVASVELQHDVTMKIKYANKELTLHATEKATANV